MIRSTLITLMAGLMTIPAAAREPENDVIFRVGTLNFTGTSQEAEVRTFVLVHDSDADENPPATLVALEAPSGVPLVPATSLPKRLGAAYPVRTDIAASVGTYTATIRDGEGETMLEASLDPEATLAPPAGLVIDAEGETVAVSWDPVEGARAYRVSLLRMGPPATMLASAGSTEPEFVLPSGELEEGTYLVVATAYNFPFAGTVDAPIDLGDLPSDLMVSETQRQLWVP